MNCLYLGLKREISFPRNGYLYIADEVPEIKRARVFDPLRHSFNPLHKINYRSACEFVDIIDALFSRGENTLTKDTGLDFIHDCLEAAPKTLEDLIPTPDRKASTGHQWAFGKVRRILRSPVLTRMLCSATNFSFNPRSTILARVSRKELGDFDATAIVLFLMAQFRGQIILEDGSYLRDFHTNLLREDRLIVGANHLSELPQKLRSAFLLGKVTPHGTTFEDAVVLANYAGLAAHSNGFNDFISASMAA